MAIEVFIFGLFRADALILEEVAIGLGELFHKGGLFVICLEEAILVRSKLFEFSFEKLVLVVGYRLLV